MISVNDLKSKISKSIFDKAKSFIGSRINKNLGVLKSQVPGRLRNITSIQTQETSKGLNIEVKVNSPLSRMLDSGDAYSSYSNLSLSRIRIWASHKGLIDSAVPIWLKIKNRGPKKQYTDWIKKDLIPKTKDLLK
ncbi:hypothetical protein [Borrelia crocidurae]|uniref:Uncharacterized protein n=1 Tax=Borrelia crocidurae (strain Achema) TaxID=1155096 RepID=I0FEK1_BORCA|nr:hypothetical protein [Borrelia crocidurae]AFI31907.1 hypothetical protein Q7M_1451 [Borrelia crocidurae str. Achema]